MSVEVESQVELRNVVEDRESEGGQNESEEEKEADTSFVVSLVLSHVRMVTRVPETAPENPPELGEIQLHRHVDPILGADVVGAGPLALILLGHVEDRAP